MTIHDQWLYVFFEIDNLVYLLQWSALSYVFSSIRTGLEWTAIDGSFRFVIQQLAPYIGVKERGSRINPRKWPKI